MVVVVARAVAEAGDKLLVVVVADKHQVAAAVDHMDLAVVQKIY